MWDRKAWVNNADSEQTLQTAESDQGLQFQLIQQFLDTTIGSQMGVVQILWKVQ